MAIREAFGSCLSDNTVSLQGKEIPSNGRVGDVGQIGYLYGSERAFELQQDGNHLNPLGVMLVGETLPDLGLPAKAA